MKKIVNNIRRKFFTNTSLDNWYVNNDCISYLIRISNIIIDSKDANLFYTGYHDHYEGINNPVDRLIIKLFSTNKKLFVDFLDFNEQRVIFSFNLADFIHQKKNLRFFLINKFNYNSDFGFHLFSDNDKYSYFFNESFFYVSDIKNKKTWENFHLFIVNKSVKAKFSETAKGLFLVHNTVKNQDYYENRIFGENVYHLTPLHRGLLPNEKIK